MKKLGLLLSALLMTIVLCGFTTSDAHASDEAFDAFVPGEIHDTIRDGTTFNVIRDEIAFDRKIYSDVSIDEDFDGTSVMVIVNRKFSGINKRHSADFFGDIKFTSIDDLTAVPDNLLTKDSLSMSRDNSSASKDDLSVLAAEAKSRIDEKNFEQVLQISLPQDSKETVIRTIKQLERIEGIKYAGPNRIREVEVTTPNDTLFRLPATATTGQWGLEKIQARDAWDITTGSRNVRVGIIDTGVGNLVAGQADHPDLNANLVAGGDFVNMTSIPNNTPGALRADPDGHGTFVAGIVGAAGNNGVGIAGVNWNVSLVPLQVANATGGIVDAACVRAITFATNSMTTNQPISIGGYTVWPEIETVIRQYSNAGGLFVCSTGNSGGNNDTTRHYPSFYGSSLHKNTIANMIAVGRTDINDTATSNFGAQTVHLFAPGQSITSTVPLHRCNASGSGCAVWGTHVAHGYHRDSGSSFSTPHVAGVAALIKSLYPTMSARGFKCGN